MFPCLPRALAVVPWSDMARIWWRPSYWRLDHVRVTLLFSSLPIGAFQWPITSSITLTEVTYLAQTMYLYNNCDITFLTVFILTHPVNFPCGRKPETLFTWVRSENPTHALRGERSLLWRQRHWSPQRWSELRPSHFSNSFLYHSYTILLLQITRYRSHPRPDTPKSFSYKSYRDNLLVRGGWT
jgi:hypothetical protein